MVTQNTIYITLRNAINFKDVDWFTCAAAEQKQQQTLQGPPFTLVTNQSNRRRLQAKRVQSGRTK